MWRSAVFMRPSAGQVVASAADPYMKRVRRPGRKSRAGAGRRVNNRRKSRPQISRESVE